ncbi:peptidoglycan editing factor PgeF [Pseudoxanthobacter sp.]|uniref:peptidoglycan editing factor PgeF n=1 Tax=Pseudoxanthobacter sp. TaxID=1925742 RepID=UPI002FE3CE4D
MIVAEELAGLAGIRHGFFTREGGVSSGLYASLNTGLGSSDDRAAVLENRARVARALGVEPANFVTAYQIHSPTVHVVDTVWAPGEGPQADALVCRRPGIAIGVSAADCGPLLFADAAAGVVGAAHAGWKGAFGGVIEATLAAMEAEGADRANVVAVLGPTISQAAYEVGPEFVARFRAADPQNDVFFRPSGREDHALFDLPAYIGRRLVAAGVGRAGDVGLCTYADEQRFFSFRRTTHRGEADYGRLVAAIALSAA